MSRITTKKIALYSVMIALVFVATWLTTIKISLVKGGYFNIGDTVIMVTAVIFGKYGGMLAGALGSSMADMVLGSFYFAPVTFIVKGLEGYVVGSIAENRGVREAGETRRIVAMVAGALVMVAGYFISEATILTLVDSEMGWAAAMAELPLNSVQGGISAAVGYALSTALVRLKVKELV